MISNIALVYVNKSNLLCFCILQNRWNIQNTFPYKSSYNNLHKIMEASYDFPEKNVLQILLVSANVWTFFFSVQCNETPLHWYCINNFELINLISLMQ